MVEHILRDPQVLPVLETEPRSVLPPPEGPCLVCGEWVGGEAEGVYAVRVERHRGAAASLVAHAACLARVAHASVRLPD
jgi:hypothetical protein